MKTKIAKSFLFLSSLGLLCGCINQTSSGSTSKEQPLPQEDEKLDYEDFYQNDTKKVEVKSGPKNYRSSDGYKSSREQGYNGFYYEILDGEAFRSLELANNEFIENGIGFKNEYLYLGSGATLSRLFAPTFNGNATIRMPVILVESSGVKITLYQGSNKVLEQNITTSSYFEKSLNITTANTIRFVVEGNGTVIFNPEIDYTNQEGLLHTACDGFYGDVHPYYNEVEKKLYMFYLSTGNQSHNRTTTFQSMLTSSTDMIHFNDDLCVIDEKGRPEQDLYFVLNVYKDKDGKYRSSQGYNMKCSSSMSSDLHTWSMGNKPYFDKDDGFLKYTYDVPFSNDVYSGRDPDTFYDKDSDKYYTVVMNYYTSFGANGVKHLNLYIGDSEAKYSPNATKLINFTNRGDPECPQIKKIGDRWYLFYSVYGTGTAGNVGKLAYRVGDKNVLPQNVDWNRKEELYLDGGDLHAAQIFNIGEKYYVYGWLQYQFNSNVWGGYLNIPHEVTFHEDGTLGTRLDEKLMSLLYKGDITTEVIMGTTEVGNVNRNIINATVIGYNSEIKIADYSIKITFEGNKNYLVVDNGVYNNRLEIKNASEYKLTIVKDQQFIDIDVNGDSVMSCHTNAFDSRLVLNPGVGQIKDVKVSKLASLENIYN